MAGRFVSVGPVATIGELCAAVDRVIADYARNRIEDIADRVLVQPYLQGSAVNGVATTRDANTGSPYTVVTWANGSDTSVVTAGRDCRLRSWYALEGAAPPPAEIADVTALLAELRDRLGCDGIEIEFAFASGLLHLFQVRLLPPAPPPGPDLRIALTRAVRRLPPLASTPPQRDAARSGTVLANMTDWNPAEIIGARPKPLADDLYRRIVTDDAWAWRRKDYGYRTMRNRPLMLDVAGQPYVDARTSFESLIPAALDDSVAQRLCETYLDALRRRPELQDKIEFEIVLSAFVFDIDRRALALGLGAGDRAALHRAAAGITEHVIAGRARTLDADLAAVAGLADLAPAHRPETLAGLDRYWLLARGGARAFAGIARAAFIATALLKSAVAAELIAQEDLDGFMQSLGTVARRIRHDLHRLPRERFLRRYGHLRPGTYDVTSPRYDEAFETYFPADCDTGAPDDLPGEDRPASYPRLAAALARNGFGFDDRDLFAFARDAIVGREWAKLVFSRPLSDGLRRLTQLAAPLGLEPGDLAFASLRAIARAGDGDAARAILGRAIEARRKRYALTESVILPPVIRSPDDLLSFELPLVQPNFITRGSARGAAAWVEAGSVPRGCIALIMSADPGYDWLFARRIAGLITAYGGANSHMAVRAQELNLPAVIGVGEDRIRQWRNEQVLEIDGAARTIRALP